MKLIAKNGKKILKMTKAEWISLGRQYKWAGTVPDAEKVKQVIHAINQLAKDMYGLAYETSGYKFLTERKQLMELHDSMSMFLGIVEKTKGGSPAIPPSDSPVKTAQNLDAVKTPEKFTDREVTRAIRDAIIAEEGAVKQYETVVDATDNALIKEVLQDISNEEKVHVGELQSLLKELLKDEEGFLEDGAKEVADKK